MGKPIAARTTLQPTAQHAIPASHKVKLVLRRGIVTGMIPCGTRLVQTSIASEMEVGARQVRDALRELAAEGFVKLDSRGGAVVHELGRSELQDIYEIRMMLEPVATARAATLATTEIMLQAAGLLAVMETETGAALWAERNSTFHDLNDVYVTADGIGCAVDCS
jgi:DNA-binding GntR family transcriptional regulator